jgi:hypothetical protein
VPEAAPGLQLVSFIQPTGFCAAQRS